MRYIILSLLLSISVFGSIYKTHILDVKGDIATIKIDDAQKGVSGIVVKKLAKNRSIIINNAEVIDFDKNKKIAKLKLTKFTMFKNNNLPDGKWSAKKGDLVIMAFGYSRGLIIAPDEDIYFTLKKAIRNEVFVHPDVFATMLSFNGHPTPLKSDFQSFCNNVTIGLLFFYLEKKLYTVDCKTFKILNVQNAPLEKNEEKLPFYSRVKKIDANWFGEGHEELEDYEPYYYELLYKANKDNTALKKAIISSDDENVTKLAKELDLK